MGRKFHITDDEILKKYDIDKERDKITHYDRIDVLEFFNDRSDKIITLEEFLQYLQNKLDELAPSCKAKDKVLLECEICYDYTRLEIISPYYSQESDKEVIARLRIKEKNEYLDRQQEVKERAELARLKKKYEGKK